MLDSTGLEIASHLTQYMPIQLKPCFIIGLLDGAELFSHHQTLWKFFIFDVSGQILNNWFRIKLFSLLGNMHFFVSIIIFEYFSLFVFFSDMQYSVYLVENYFLEIISRWSECMYHDDFKI